MHLRKKDSFRKNSSYPLFINSAADEDTDNQAVVQYFSNPASDKRIVVFGHTHAVRMTVSDTRDGKKGVYVNSGTWIDHNNGNPTRTFVSIIPAGDRRYIGLYSFSSEGEIEILGTSVLDL